MNPQSIYLLRILVPAVVAAVGDLIYVTDQYADLLILCFNLHTDEKTGR